MKFKKIGIRMLAFILPVIITAMLVLTIISGMNSKNIIDDQITQHMSSELNGQNSEISNFLQIISATAQSISCNIGTSYQTTDITTYENMLSEVIQTNDSILGSGIWFEPYVFNPEEQYVGPYVYKDGDDIRTTYDYSNADYDYFSQDYYTLAKESGTVNITDPYFDSSSGMIMSSCSAPIYSNGVYIGCVTVDISLDQIQNLIDAIQIGDGGTAVLMTVDGVFLGGVDSEKVEGGASILDDENPSLAEAGNIILSNENGTTTYTDDTGETYNLYYDTIPTVNWTLAIKMPQSELNQPVKQLILRLLLVCIIAIAASIIVVLNQVSSISKSISHVKTFATSLAEGDFTIPTLHVKTEDEIGHMGNSLNDMFLHNKNVISSISEHAINIDDSSNQLNAAAKNLSEEFEHISTYMSNVNEAMMTASAATEEVNASTEEVESNVNLLANETSRSMDMAKDIRNRASSIGESSKTAFDTATNLSTQFEKRLQISIENAKVVENIGDLANVISEIAEQINLLSLNASIEAARAGEQGKGFAVVATEIGHLANDTSSAVERIQATISDVNEAFHGLTSEATGLLDFIQQTVTPDYNNFVDVADQYGKDAVSIEDISSHISDMSTNIKHIMSEVTSAIQNIAESAQKTADVSSEIMSAVSEVSDVVTNVSDMSESQQAIADDLKDVVSNFKLDDSNNS